MLCACKCNYYTLSRFHFQWGLYLHVPPAQHGGHGRGDHGSARTAVAEQNHVPGLPTIPRTGSKTVIIPKRHEHLYSYILVDLLRDASTTATYKLFNYIDQHHTARISSLDKFCKMY